MLRPVHAGSEHEPIYVAAGEVRGLRTTFTVLGTDPQKVPAVAIDLRAGLNGHVTILVLGDIHDIAARFNQRGETQCPSS